MEVRTKEEQLSIYVYQRMIEYQDSQTNHYFAAEERK